MENRIKIKNNHLLRKVIFSILIIYKDNNSGNLKRFFKTNIQSVKQVIKKQPNQLNLQSFFKKKVN